MPELTDFLSEIDWCCLTQFISTWASSLSVLMLFPSWSDLLSKSNRQGFFRSRQGFFRSGDDVRFPVSWERGVILLSPWLMLPWTSMLSSGCKVLRFFNAQCQFSTLELMAQICCSFLSKLKSFKKTVTKCPTAPTQAKIQRIFPQQPPTVLTRSHHSPHLWAVDTVTETNRLPTAQETTTKLSRF